MSESANNRLIGVAIYLLAFSIMPTMDIAAKYLGDHMPVMQVTWGRYFFHFIFLMPIVLYKYGLGVLKPDQFGLQVVRGGFLLGATLCFFGAIVYMPLADALAITFISPLLVTLLSPFVLGESIGKFRIIAVFVGFLGAVIIIRPSGDSMGIGSLMAVGTGVLYACYSMATRKLSGSAPTLVTLAFTALLGTVIMTAALPFYWQSVPLEHVGLMAWMGISGALCHFFFIKAFDYAEASFLAPFSYSEIIVATLLGWVVFNDFPDFWTWTGAGIVIASGIFISLRERARSIKDTITSVDTPPNY